MLENITFTLIDEQVDGKDLLSSDVLSSLSQVIAIIDLASEDKKAATLSSILHVPLMMIDSISENSANTSVMSIRPPYHVVMQALFDVMDFFNFSRIAVVYDARRVREASYFYAKAKRWPRFNIKMIPELILNDREKLHSSLTELFRSRIKEIILLCDQRDLYHIMNEALYVGINDKDYRWITPDLEVAGAGQTYNHTYPSFLGMVGLRLHIVNETLIRNLKSRATGGKGAEFSLPVYAAVHDVALVVGTAVVNLFNTDPRITRILSRLDNGKCAFRSKSSKRRRLGLRLLKQIRKVKLFHEEGLTGEIQFKLRTGERRVHDGLDIVNIVQNRTKKLGSWQPEPERIDHRVSVNNEHPEWVGDFAHLVQCNNPGKNLHYEPEPIPVLKVITVLEPPFVEKVNESTPLPDGIIPKNQLQGFCIDLIEEISKKANFDYEIYLDNSYKGMVDALKSQKKDLALAPITITAERELIIDFSKPFMDFGMSLIMRKPGEPPINIFAFLLPFTNNLWLSTIVVVLFITGMMCVMDYLSPFGYRARARDSDEEPGNEFNLLNSLWFATASVLQQGPDNTPLSPSGRLLASSFWFFILIMITTYTANLAAFFTIKREVQTINSLKELESQNQTTYGVLRTGSVQKFFQNSENPIHMRMFSFMRSQQTFVNSTANGVKKAREENYAYITEYPYLAYYNQQKPCNTRLLDNLLQAKGYGIGLQQNSPHTNKISVEILELRENGFIEKTRRKWWDERSQCPKPSKSKTGKIHSLDVDNMAGVFLILLSGVILSIFILLIEIRYKKLAACSTSGQNALKRYLRRSCKAQKEESDHLSTPAIHVNPVTPDNPVTPVTPVAPVTPVRVAVVLSQGDKVLEQLKEEKGKGKGWNKWFQGVGKTEVSRR
ncbi:glutamate receptor ionotropic, kainate 2-like [Pocillopora damicornis]|uniref:glutamate receptor ionotropic, kainate 2-like n=1 Tax=Pocillopora damicornis TaxID=46731 RepID=UPI000F5582C1|nr:glutamate receptor ionotropic, kainate 2-like [Pocillopora damicornis]